MPRLSAALSAAALLVVLPSARAWAQPGYDAAPRDPAAAQPGDDDDAAPADRRASGARPPGVYRGRAIDPQPAGPQGPTDGGGPRRPDFRRDLRLRPDQGPALRDFLAATTPTDDDRRREEDALRRSAAMTTPQRLDAAAVQLRRDQADFARRAEAIRRFYGQLTPDQQRRFDQITGPPPEAGSGMGPDAGPDGGADPGGAPPR